MLPVLSTLKTKLIAGTVAVALLATSAAPALAWSRDDQIFARGVGATLLLGYLATNGYRRPLLPQPQPQQHYQEPRHYQQPIYQPVYNPPVVYVPAPQQSIYNSAAAYSFNGYSMNERRRIQATLTNYGYYHGALDGTFGPGVYNAIFALAQNTNRSGLLGTQAGSAELYDSLLG